MATFKQIFKAADELGCVWNTLGYSVNALLASAEVNASDTVYVEKSAPEADFDAIALSSLENLLCFSDDQEAAAWFKAQGVRW